MNKEKNVLVGIEQLWGQDSERREAYLGEPDIWVVFTLKELRG
jgi:hypothetical protein